MFTDLVPVEFKILDMIFSLDHRYLMCLEKITFCRHLLTFMLFQTHMTLSSVNQNLQAAPICTMKVKSKTFCSANESNTLYGKEQFRYSAQLHMRFNQVSQML